ncbi:ABC transporter ATP-binding protein [Halothermothrix orenii]|uniref:ABC transporter related n=1 Tax=Halothermothrix orenii (strain H 168 / OCM 544 / DSM 9562) TaxID=373903 RepID=B8CZK1_HALOH|nr:ABC transporter ATP-binding protein [Halothermothrix orenii]ACL70720.1 ABC transporter related [Halothermothrix orenii H 168]
MDSLIEVNNLTKVFKEKDRVITALKNVSFRVKSGEIFGLLGPNGAGKTTTLRIISTLMVPTEGEVTVKGYNTVTDSQKVRSSLGFLTAEMNLYDYFTVRELLEFFARVNGMPGTETEKRIPQILKQLGLEEYADRRVDNFSTGMKQKVSIARALLPDPPILIFDEPINGLDIMAARVVTRLIEQLRDRGKSIIVSTHNMTLAESICDRLGILFDGELIATGSHKDLSGQTGEERLEDIFFKLVGEDYELDQN